MNQNWITYLQLLKLQKQQRKRVGAVIAALSVAVTGSVSWKLHGIGTAMVDEALTDSGERYAETLSADGSLYENPSVWEATLPDVSGLELSERIAAVAESQLGYQESRWSFTNELGEELQKRYSRYGNWYGNPSGDWNTMFTYFCLHYGGADENAVPYGSGCWAWSVELEKNGLITPVSRGSPQRGDVIFLDTDLDGKADRSGVITCISGEEEQQLLKAAEGDVAGAVAEQKYSFSDEYLIGYLHIEAEEDDTPPDAAELPEDAQAKSAEFSGVTDSGITVRAVADENAFPADTVMTVSDIAREEAVKAAADSLGKEEEALDAVAVDISFRDADGTEIEPAPESSVQVQISLPEELRLGSGAYSLLHVSDEGDVQTVENASVSADGAEFDAESFSIYVLTRDRGYVQPSGLVMINGNRYGGNSQDNPYMIYLGEELTVAYQGPYKDDHTFTVYSNDYSGYKVIDRTSGKPETNGAEYRTAYFTGVHAGTCRIVMQSGEGGWGTEANVAESLWVKVVDPIYVKTFYGEKGKDWIKEYLGGYGHIYNKNGYIQNTGRNPYLLRVGDQIAVRCNAAGSFSVADSSLLSGPEHIGDYYVYTALDPGNLGDADGKTTSITHSSGSTVNDTIYVRVMKPDRPRSFTHCDMEIADDGKYTYTIINGTEKIVREYKAYVSNINQDTVLYDKNGNELTRMPVAAYKKLGKPGDTQYELTSAYYAHNYTYEGDKSLLNDVDFEYFAYKMLDENGNIIMNGGQPVVQYTFWAKPFKKDSSGQYIKDEDGHYLLEKQYDDWAHRFENDTIAAEHGACQFDPNDVDHVVFDVGLELHPDKEYRFNGTELVSTTDISSQPIETIPSTIFCMEDQSIIDAFNKCPLDNGTDFTVQPMGALIQFTATKELVNNLPLKSQQFEFELLSSADGIKAAKVGSAGVGGGKQLPNNAFSVQDVFADVQTGDLIKAYQLIRHSDPMGYNSTYLDSRFGMETTYSDWTVTAGLIDGFVLNQMPFGKESKFYNAVTKYIKTDQAIAPDADGNYNLENGHYLFEKYTVVAEAKNDADGNIKFPYQAFNKPGVYHLLIREKNTGDPNVKTYDANIYPVTVTVNDDMSVDVTYQGGDTPTFVNELNTYTLPATGGTGTVPYAVTGITMIAGATWLLLRTRRKEDN